MITIDCKKDERWLELAVAALRVDGCAVVLNVLDEPLIEETRAALYRVQQRIRDDVGEDRLRAAGNSASYA